MFWSEIDFFKEKDFACPCCGRNFIDLKLVMKLDLARTIAGIPFIINSACRCEKHNYDVGGSVTSSHKEGLAVDIKCVNSVDRFIIINALIRVGFVRILIYKNFIHVDIDSSKSQNIISFMN